MIGKSERERKSLSGKVNGKGILQEKERVSGREEKVQNCVHQIECDKSERETLPEREREART